MAVDLDMYVDRPVEGDVSVAVVFTLPHDYPNLRATEFEPVIKQLIADGKVIGGHVAHHCPTGWETTED